ncbi:elongation factor P maturation arginine rhamnosyltransferase EarP [Zhongshania aliphaticivorans]|uniref:elongation factor P maturation arginine rhamnosyltransferase EarP n=1 Tax=Zhongshania aliphaticivorans TaxID=1470434 RepID=UPI0012E507AA|nr:elongation factor P maturation arginine rhamnosyltransferase EarP [Zhongshania aliphaticivorans]CAA0101718.1 Uncharacterised protein [Zhongshania aliphaticivorans]
MRTSWDIFCHVIDNYGDAGVCWRLARQLAEEYDAEVRLWVDDPETLARLSGISPTGISSYAPRQIGRVWVHYWSPEWREVVPADVVVEAFGCQLPLKYLAAMAARSVPPLWLNLEYLSAEDWVAGCHGLPSLQQNGLQKYFFFPGFSTNTGGLLRETNLLQRRSAFQQNDRAKAQFLSTIGVDEIADSTLVSLFCYENPALTQWLDAICEGQRRYHFLVPVGRVVGDVCRWLGREAFELGERYQRGSVCIQFIPFLSQPDYDLLLWSCDFNVVRGEDSFVRAQWAARPFLWHIYPQQEGAHFVKLDAFLRCYNEGLSAGAKTATISSWLAWNTGVLPADMKDRLFVGGADLVGHSEDWAAYLEGQNNLAESLVQFYQNWV